MRQQAHPHCLGSVEEQMFVCSHTGKSRWTTNTVSQQRHPAVVRPIPGHGHEDFETGGEPMPRLLRDRPCMFGADAVGTRWKLIAEKVTQRMSW